LPYMKHYIFGALLWPFWVWAQTPSENEFSFIILGDSQFEQPAEFNEIVEEVALLNPSFVIQVGDLIYGRDVNKKALSAEWQRFKGQLAPLDDIPYYPVPGNHDVETGDKRDQLKEQAYMEAWGRDLYYSFDYKNAHFTVLNSIDPEEYSIGPEQIEWLEKDLVAAQAQDHRFVMFHHPIYTMEMEDQLHALFLKYGVRAVFYGHFHHYESMVRDGIPYIMTNATGKSAIYVEEAGNFHHFLHATIKDDEFSFCLVRKRSILPPFMIQPEDNRLYHLERFLFPENPVSVSSLIETDSSYQFSLILNNPTFQDLTAFIQWEYPNQRWQTYPNKGAKLEMKAESKDNQLDFEFVRVDDSVIEQWPVCRIRIPFLTAAGTWIEGEYVLIIEE
ncbi:MAG: metallophosphoesterase, partial [Bacteroidota bacterium]